MSSLLQFDLLAPDGEELGVSLFADTTETLDVDVPAGGTVEGEVAYEVPAGATGYIAIYSDLLTEDDLRWAVN